MSAGYPSTAALPDALAVFPLTGGLLLPGGRLPLNIFEPRYVKMVEAAIKGNRLIGMVQPLAGDTQTVGDTAPIYETGCVGRIMAFSETADGRYLITLSGICRFHIVRELEMVDGYRRVEPDYAAFDGDLARGDDDKPDREALLSAFRSYLVDSNPELDFEAVETLPDPALVTTLAMVCPFAPAEKQALLECPTLVERSRLLTSLMEMAARDIGTPCAPSRH